MNKETITKEKVGIKPIDITKYLPEKNQVIIISYKSNPYMVNKDKTGTKRFFVDKNMNIVVPHIYDSHFPKSYPRLPKYLTPSLEEDCIHIKNNPFVVINQKRLFESRGKEFVINYKSNITYREILSLKKYYKSNFGLIEETSEQLKSIIGSVYNEDSFDIIFNHHPKKQGNITFIIIIRHDNVVITNSIEQSKHIGTLFTYLFGLKLKDGQLLIAPFMKGTRLTYSFSDIISNYTHSHMTSNAMRTFSTFCTGSENSIFYGTNGNDTVHFDGINYKFMSELDIEGLMIAIQDFIRWESLEGGPHRKMESVAIFESGILDNVHNKSKILKSDNVPTSTRKTIVDFLLAPENLEAIKPYFIIIKKGSYYRFTYNSRAIVEKFVRLLNSNEEIRILFKEYAFDPSSGAFGRINAKEEESVHELVEKRKRDLLPSYINGKTLPAIVKEDEKEKEIIDNILLSIHPSEYMKIADSITKVLNDELIREEREKIQ